MNLTFRRTIGFLVFMTLIAAIPALMYAQTAPANSVVGYPGAGVVQVGDYWESLLPATFGPYYGEAGDAPTRGNRTFIRFGNFDRNWTTPNGHWPSAFPWTMYWGHYMEGMEYNPDTTWNPAKIGGADNASFFSGAAGPSGLYSNFSYIATNSRVNGYGDAARRYSKEPYYVDGARRQHVVYEVGFPTNLGVDVKIRAHGFAGPNWGNLNDFVIVEMELHNTGYLDLNMDGVAERTNNDIRALSFVMSGEIYQSVGSYPGGGRNVNSISTKYTRMGGWVNDPDPDGFPWAFNAYYAGASVAAPGAGQHDLGFNAPTMKMYTDTWDGWAWLGVKKGGLPADASFTTGSQPTQPLIFGTDPVGVGPQRGWYISSGSGGSLVATVSNPKQMYTAAVGAFFANGGRSRSLADLNQGPNASFFASGTSGNITTFVPKASPAQPDGDQKTLNTFDQTPFENGNAASGQPYPAGWGKWTSGYNFAHDFNGDQYSGIGPISIPKDSTVTVVLALGAGYRLEGLQRAIYAARWTYETGAVAGSATPVPQLPPLPDLKVSNTLTKTVTVEWNKAAESDPGFAGYKIWKSSGYKKKNWLNEGLRLSDRYQEQMSPTESTEPLKKPVNPQFDAFGDIANSGLKGVYQPDTWGTWELVKTIPVSDLPSLAAAKTPGYNYFWEDKDVVLGFSYWYYVSAYKEGTFTGPGGATTTRIETHSTNRNGADGLWHKTFPFALTNPNFPSDAAGLKAMGAVQRVFSALAAQGDVSTVGVRPNPYKRAAFHDNISNVFDHKLLFYNLPPQCTITIIDVAGLIVDQIRFSSNDPNNGSYFWDMFSKDGIEVASGLYIYTVESPTGGKKIGYFSILR